MAPALAASDVGAGSATVLVDEVEVGGSSLAKAWRPALTASALAASEDAGLVRNRFRRLSRRVDCMGRSDILLENLESALLSLLPWRS
jgi:hypothetical protein